MSAQATTLFLEDFLASGTAFQKVWRIREKNWF